MNEAAALCLVYSSLLLIPFMWLCDFVVNPWPTLKELDRIAYMLQITIEEVHPYQWPAQPKRKRKAKQRSKPPEGNVHE